MGLIFRILAIISLIVMILSIIIKVIFKFKKNHYFRPFKQDQLVKQIREGGSNNQYFLVSGPDADLIPRYVFRKSVYEYSVVCNFKKNFKRIVYYIVSFNEKNKVLDVLEVCEENTIDTSRVIIVNKKTKKVNIVVRDADSIRYNQSYIIPMSTKNIWLNQFFNTLILFNSLYVIRYLLVQLFASQFTTYYSLDMFGQIGLICIIVTSFIYFFVGAFETLNKNQKERAGGKVSYEFY